VEVLTGDMHRGGCSVSVHTYMSVALTEKCMKTGAGLKELAKHTGMLQML
jgi:hypothetical protein